MCICVYMCVYIHIYNLIFCVCVCVYIHIYIQTEIFKELVHVIVRAGKHKICRAGRPAGNACRISVLQSRSRIPFQQTSVFALYAFH